MGKAHPELLMHYLFSSWAILWGLGTIPHFTDEEVQVGFDEQLATFTQPVVSNPEVCAINQQS